jgi:hypothetical protein
MKYKIRNIPGLKNILWADFVLGGSTALVGLIWHRPLTSFLGLPSGLIVIIAAVTLAYALLALTLAYRSQPAIPLLRGLIYANWAWTVVSIGLVICYIAEATVFGAVFLLLQVVVVGGLAYLEGRHIQSQAGD